MRVPYQRQLLYIINREIELRLGADSYEGKLLKHLMDMVPPSLLMGPSIKLIVQIVDDVQAVIQKKLVSQTTNLTQLELKEIVCSTYKTSLSNHITTVLGEAASDFDWERALAPSYAPPRVGSLQYSREFAASCLLVEYNPIDYTDPKYGRMNYLCGSLLSRYVLRKVLSRTELKKKPRLAAVIYDERTPSVSGFLFECLVANGVPAERHTRPQTDLMSVDESSASSPCSSSLRLRQLDPDTSMATGDVVTTLAPTFVHPILGTTTPSTTHNKIAAALKDLTEQHGPGPWSALLDFRYEKTPTVDGAIVECDGKEDKLRLYPAQTTIAREKTLASAMTWVKDLREVLAHNKLEVEVPFFSVLRPSMNDSTMSSYENQLVNAREPALDDCKYTLIDHNLTAVIKDTDSVSLFQQMLEAKIDMIKEMYDDSLTAGQRPYRGLPTVWYPNPYGDDSTCPHSSASTTE
jgi:hypothetical protein